MLKNKHGNRFIFDPKEADNPSQKIHVIDQYDESKRHVKISSLIRDYTVREFPEEAEPINPLLTHPAGLSKGENLVEIYLRERGIL
ncbi:hypothetical protein LCGC14_2874200 [marine sediment metagenome]|uniref:Uncharacterized protein n=1 Tax=marine sediment metagenome TaxID=412755 RepID=A0A0F8Y291_9ZZZZ